MDKAVLRRIKKIEAAAYPRGLREISYCNTWQDVAEYCEVELDDLIVVVEATWYCLVAVHPRGLAEWIDLARIPGSPRLEIQDWRRLLGILDQHEIQILRADCRAKTSLKRIQQLADLITALGWTVTEGKKETRSGETFVEITAIRAPKFASP